MPLVSVLTPVKESTPLFFLQDLYDSLRRQDVDWEWIVQWDSEGGSLPDLAQEDMRVRAEANGRRLLAAMSRNRALLRAKGDLVRNLDADDSLPDGALRQQIDVFKNHPDISFSPGAELSFETGELSLPRIPVGVIHPGDLEAYWRREKSIAISHATILWRREAIWRAGGWPAQSGMDDVALTLLANIEESGFVLHEPVLLRRSHAEQNTIQPLYVQDRTINKQLIHERIHGKRKSLGLEIPAGWDKAPEDINRDKAIAKGKLFGHQYNDA